MAETMVIHYPGMDAQQLSWLIKGGLQTLTGAGSPADAGNLTKGRRVQVLIPAKEVLITQVAIPTKNRQRLLQAIPFSLETELTQDVEQLHFAIGATDQDNNTPVIVIARDTIEEWISVLESQGIEALGIYLDLLCLPLEEESWSLLSDGGLLQIHSGPYQGFCADFENADALLDMALQQAGDSAPQSLTLYQEGEQAPSLPQTVDTRVVSLESPDALISLLAEALDEKQQINLLQGDYKKVDKLTLQWRRWLPAAVLTGVALLFVLTLNIFDYYHYQQQSRELNQRIHQVFKQAFPDIKRIIEPKQQMEQQLKLLRGNRPGSTAQFAALFPPSAVAIKGSPDARLESVSFRDGQLDLQLTVKELPALEKLKQSIEQQQLSVEIRAANASGDQVSSHLRVSEAGK